MQMIIILFCLHMLIHGGFIYGFNAIFKLIFKDI